MDQLYDLRPKNGSVAVFGNFIERKLSFICGFWRIFTLEYEIPPKGIHIEYIFATAKRKTEQIGREMFTFEKKKYIYKKPDRSPTAKLKLY